MTSAPRLEGTALQLYRGVLCLYPAEFRAAYTHELCLFFVDRWREENTVARRLLVWLISAAAVLREAPKEHAAMILQDLRYALRVLRKDRLVTGAAIGILALGIGATTLVFSLANGLLVRPLPYSQLDRLVEVSELSPRDPRESDEMNYLNYLDLRARTKLFAHLGLYTSGMGTIRGEGEAETVPAAAVTDDTLPALGVAPLLGRFFTRAECLYKGPSAVILSAELWRHRYGSDPHILGRTLQIGKQRATVVGIMPADFHFPDRVQFWKPLQVDTAESRRTDYYLQGIGLLRKGVTPAQASAELQGLLATIHRENPAGDNGYSITARLYREFVSANYRRAVLMLLLGVGLLLLIACANVSNLLLVKASARSREMALRTAIGASRGRIIRQLVVEGLVLGLAGGVAGLGLALVGVPGLLSLIPEDLPRWMNFSPDARVLAFCLALSILTSLGFTVAPAFNSLEANVTEALKEARGGGTRRRARRLQRGMVVAEVALSFTLLAAAGLMIRSFNELRYQPLGFAPERVITFALNIPTDHFPMGQRFHELTKQLRAEVATLPGVQSVAMTSGVPFGDSWSRIFTIEGHELPLEKLPNVNHIVSSPEYFRTLGIPLLAGRAFTEEDYDRPLLIVTRSFANRYWPQANPLGKRVRFGPPSAHEPWHTVIGVVGDNRHDDLRSRERTNVYLPPTAAFGDDVLVVRGTTEATLLVPAVRRQLTAIDRDIAVSGVVTLEQYLDRNVWRDRFLAVLFAAFAVLALILASAGLYASLAYAVSLQTHEIGVRVALGASAARVRQLIAWQGGSLVVGGLVLGGVAATALSRAVRAQLFVVSPYDPLTYAVAPLVLLCAALLAMVVPIRRAIRIDPVDALREQ